MVGGIKKASFRIRRIRRGDERAAARIIRRVLGEYGANRPGFAPPAATRPLVLIAERSLRRH